MSSPTATIEATRADPPRAPDEARPIRTPGFRARDPEALAPTLAALRAGAWAEPPRLAKREGRRATWVGALRTDAGDVPAALKQLPHRRGLRGALSRAARLTKGERQCDGAARLLRAGVRAATPIALLRGRLPDGRPCDWLVLERLPGEDVIRLLKEGSLGVREAHDVARRVGLLARAIADAGLVNRDCKLSNLVRMPDGEMGVVDTDGVEARLGAAAHYRALPEMLLSMLREAKGTGLMPRRTLLMRALKAACGEDAREWWERLAGALAAAGDTTPRVDPTT